MPKGTIILTGGRQSGRTAAMHRELAGHRHVVDSRTMRCSCGKPAEQCKREQGSVAMMVSQPIPSNRTGDRVFFRGHEVRPIRQ